MLVWAKEDPKNESAFWERIYPKLLPLTVAGDPDAPVSVSLIELRPMRGDSQR